VATVRPHTGGGADVFYVHTDQLNTPRTVSRPSDNALMWSWYSDPFGTDAANDNPAGAGTFKYNLRFAGQLFDGQAGLHHNGWRDFDPAVGRYIESDPIGLHGGIDTYAYVAGNPISRIDFLGLWWFGDPLPQSMVDASAGLGDALLLDQGARLRRLFGVDGGIDLCSGSYHGGQAAGIIGGLISGEGEAVILSDAAHYAPRLIAEGVDVASAQAAVVGEIRAMQATLAEGESLGALAGRISVDGKLVQYNAFPLPGGNINVGTIFPVLW
jgi:RHS repeat-associated protein